jgi:hyperosmotically inducible protein
MGQIIKNIISFVIIAIILLFGYLLFIEKKSISEIFEIGKERVEDKALELKVKSQISFNKTFTDNDIDVKAEDGEITLTGTVSTPEKALLAAQIADSVQGVKRVINKIKVSSEIDERSSDGRSERERMQDREMEQKARAVLDTEEQLKGITIKVTVFKKVVFLEGKVISEFQKDLAVKLVRSIDKVRDVKEDLSIKYD